MADLQLAMVLRADATELVEKVGRARDELGRFVATAKNGAEELGKVGGAGQQASEGIGAATRGLFGFNIEAGKANQVLSQLPLQLNDLFVQLASGQGFLTAFVQQSSQVAPILSPWAGVALAAAGGLAALVSAFTDYEEAADPIAALNERLDGSVKDLSETIDGYIRRMREASDAVRELRGEQAKSAQLSILGRQPQSLMGWLRGDHEAGRADPILDTLIRGLEQPGQAPAVLGFAIPRYSVDPAAARQKLVEAVKRGPDAVYETARELGLTTSKRPATRQAIDQLADLAKEYIAEQAVTDYAAAGSPAIPEPKPPLDPTDTSDPRVQELNANLNFELDQLRVYLNNLDQAKSAAEQRARQVKVEADRRAAEQERARREAQSFEDMLDGLAWRGQQHLERNWAEQRRPYEELTKQAAQLERKLGLERQKASLVGVEGADALIARREHELELQARGIDLASKEAQAWLDAAVKVDLQTAANRRAEQQLRRNEQAAMQFGQALAQSLEHAVFRADSLQDALAMILMQMAQMAFSQAVTEPLGGVFGSLLKAGVGAVSGLFAPGAAQQTPRIIGGPVGMARPYAKGDVFSQLGTDLLTTPMNFQTSAGLAQAGEAGIEGIFPVVRMPSGRLGIEGLGAGGTSVVNHHYAVTVDARGVADPALIEAMHRRAAMAAAELIMDRAERDPAMRRRLGGR